jgi:hypothetical protein
LVAYYKVEELECVFFSERVVRSYGSKSIISFAKKKLRSSGKMLLKHKKHFPKKLAHSLKNNAVRA